MEQWLEASFENHYHYSELYAHICGLEMNKVN